MPLTFRLQLIFEPPLSFLHIFHSLNQNRYTELEQLPTFLMIAFIFEELARTISLFELCSTLDSSSIWPRSTGEKEVTGRRRPPQKRGLGVHKYVYSRDPGACSNGLRTLFIIHDFKVFRKHHHPSSLRALIFLRKARKDRHHKIEMREPSPRLWIFRCRCL